MEGLVGVLFIAGILLFIWAYRATKEKENLKIEKIGCQSRNADLNNEIDKLKDKVKTMKEELDKHGDISAEVVSLHKQAAALRAEISILEKESVAKYADVPLDYDVTSEEIKNEISLLKMKQNEFIKSGEAVKCSLAKYGQQSKKAMNDNIKQLLRCFNAETTSILSNLTVKNVDPSRNKIQKSFEILNKIFAVDMVSINEEYLKMKFEELSLLYNYQLKKEQEKEEQKAIREQMLEEEKVRREIEREKAKIEKEENQFRGEITKLMGYLQKASDVEKQLYVDKIKELEDKLKLLEKDKENVLQREQNTRAGYVYVISNIGSFGEDVYKIGMTRRLEPMDRVKELGDASVPFEFDVHAMIFSEDAPALESILHQTFKKYQVNKVNDRKEFFKVPLDEVEEVVKNNHNATVIFTKVAEAHQYRESLKLAQA